MKNLVAVLSGQRGLGESCKYFTWPDSGNGPHFGGARSAVAWSRLGPSDNSISRRDSGPWHADGD
eukprot:7077569-Pyramimonas_sp.AAC.1